MRILTIIRHWLPIVTFCPVNGLPDLLFVSVLFDDDQFHELYAIRRRVRELVSWKKVFMEDVAETVFREYQDASEIHVRLLFSRHVVIIKRRNQ